ncbi:MAG TPA: DUF1203 domain-containing protein [Rhizomicrobium sp.]|jgi:hypothetical protein|nr:DUF1203 domain-containing protein [Rhizomicrobium sp.]
MSYRFTGLEPALFSDLFALSDAELAARGMSRVTADAKPGFPCRVSLVDAEPGEQLILLPFDHQPAHSPYKASGPIFVRKDADEAAAITEGLPPVLNGRLLSLRAYDGQDLIVDAEVVPGTDAEYIIERFFARDDVSYIHIHNAKRGCYACRVDRA